MKSNKIRLHVGIHSFLRKQSLTKKSIYDILSNYAQSKEIERPKHPGKDWFLNISNIASENFKEFKKFYNKNKKDLSYSYHQSYDDWWQECNLDGSFAYNNASDDF